MLFYNNFKTLLTIKADKTSSELLAVINSNIEPIDLKLINSKTNLKYLNTSQLV